MGAAKTYLKQHRSGKGRALATGKLLPPEWELMEATSERINATTITITLKVLVTNNASADAPTGEAGNGNQQESPRAG